MRPDTGGRPRRWARAFGHFWWDFLVGDTPELLIGGVACVAVGAVVAHATSGRALAVIVLPVLVVALLATSLWRAARRAR